MATSKRDAFGQRENEIARLSKALSHPARVFILLEIARRQTCIGSELQTLIPLSQSTISQHLKDLMKVGLLHRMPLGPKSVHTINWTEFGRLTIILQQYLTQVGSFRPG